MREIETAIMHCDINHCYAQIEEMKCPELREVPMAVGGNEELRHGIILAKNLKAKEYNIKTGESLREAYEKCPELLIIHPNYEEYLYYSEKVKDIYREYTDLVESFGLDEAWVDISGSVGLFGSAYDIASTVQQRVLNEIGLTISIGLSYNKIFAKLGSDLIKPSGLVHITKDNFKEVVWKLPVQDLMYVGPATKAKLLSFGITTIGELALANPAFIKGKLGKMGEVVQCFANGVDLSQVMVSGYHEPIKSVGNSITSPKDINTFEEAKLVYYVLVESVASRLRDAGLRGSVISISLRNNKLESFTRQRKIYQSTNLADEIMEVVMALVKENYNFALPLRSIGVSISTLEPDGLIHQMNLFVDEESRAKQRVLDRTIDQIRQKYGFAKLKRCSLLLDQELTDFNPKGDHVIHPISYF